MGALELIINGFAFSIISAVAATAMIMVILLSTIRNSNIALSDNLVIFGSLAFGVIVGAFSLWLIGGVYNSESRADVSPSRSPGYSRSETLDPEVKRLQLNNYRHKGDSDTIECSEIHGETTCK